MTGRIAFFSPREFGEIGTPGTYRIVEEIAKRYEVRVYARAPSHRSVYWQSNIPLIPLKGSLNTASLRSVRSSLLQFDPDILYFFNAPKLADIIATVKDDIPNAKVILDIKTPLLVDEEDKRRSIQTAGSNALRSVDRILTHAEASIETWFPADGRPPYLTPYLLPPGIDLSAFPIPDHPQPADRKSKQSPVHWVYAAALHPKRQGSRLIDGFRIFLRQNPGMAVLHIYGDGPDRLNLERQVSNAALRDWVRFHGLVPQKELFAVLPRMDGGIGWVPRQIYDQSPSLKVLEYVAAGLPVLATATRAHRNMEQEGFTLDFCEDTPNSLAEGLARWVGQEFDQERIRQNRKAVEARDYFRLVQERVIPMLDDLLEESSKIETPKQKKAVATENRLVRSSPSEEPLRILLVMTAIATRSEKIERFAVGVADAMSSRGHRVYLAYQAHGKPGSDIDDSVVLFPYEDQEALETLIQGGRLDVMVIYSVDERSLLPLARLANRYRVALVVHDSASSERPRLDGQCAGEGSRARARWEEELLLSAATLTGHMSNIAPVKRWREWETLLRQAIVLTDDPDGSLECQPVTDYERVLHARRMRRTLLGT